ncbi:MAG: 5-formyltetrahydrofolate cyclo-ligase [Syntrophomonadaceae bacterium]|jgi:5-formyltetrahydrofolate cyclo-ligase|nr:5-formyltetrahydrofolate cyclo-ligase [Syntrophomonadaceae bacterium]
MNRNFLTKQQRREQALKERNALSFQYALQASAAVNNALAGLSFLRKADNVMAYAAFGSEVYLDEAIRIWVRQKKRVWLPRINNSERLEAVEFTGWDKCSSGSFGIREPAGASVKTDEIAAVIVPGLLFDRQGYRIGYGKGYYDKFLPLLSPGVFLCGVCFDFQLVKNIEPESFDLPVHCIVTDRQILHLRNSPAMQR